MIKVLRCMLFAKNNLYIAACLDLTLSAQANTPEEAKRKLEEQIKDYLCESLSEPAYTYDLLTRRAPLSWFARYYFIKIKILCSQGNDSTIFEESSSSYCH